MNTNKITRASLVALPVLFVAFAASPAYAQYDYPVNYTSDYSVNPSLDYPVNYTSDYPVSSELDYPVNYTSDYSTGYTPSYGYTVGSAPAIGVSTPLSGYSVGFTNPMGGNVQSQQQQQSQGQSQSSTNNNTNANANTVTSTNTNNNNSSASASTGPITISNVNNNVVNVQPATQGATAQRYTYPQPTCTLSVSNAGYLATYYNGYQPMTLTWSSSNATSAYISPSVGTVSPSGSTTVYPRGYTSYTMTVYGPGGTGTCYANANGVGAPVSYVAPTYTAPAPVYTAPTPVVTNSNPSVSLSQIPYTGFDYGPMGDAIYWSVLALFAAAAAYLMIYYRGGAFAFAGSILRGTADYSVIVDEEEAEDAEGESEEPNGLDLSHAFPVGSNVAGTTDWMIMRRGSSNEAPRIVIARA